MGAGRAKWVEPHQLLNTLFCVQLMRSSLVDCWLRRTLQRPTWGSKFLTQRRMRQSWAAHKK
eukprot:9225465-Karenia_brevis.AAC.1